MTSLDLYRAKRDFKVTSEPKGGRSRKKTSEFGAFVIHKHAATRLHYDLRLEYGGVLWSWAVTRGPSLDPDEKRLAVHVEDHPLEYGGFEGTIPEGQYGAGSVIIWDEGRWVPEGDPAFGMKKGHISFMLEGHKLHGAWHLVRLKPRRGEKRDNWLLIKVDDGAATTEGDILEDKPNSVKSGLSVEEVGKGKAGEVWESTKRPGSKTRSAKTAEPEHRSKAQTKTKAASKTKSAQTASPPGFVEPCLATLQDKPPAGQDWLHEVKFDGYRMQARIADGEVKLLTRSGLDWTEKFGSALAKALGDLPCENAVIDGEVVALTDRGVSSFSALQEALSEEKTDDLVYYAFDLLFLDGEDLRDAPLLARKERLQTLISEAEGHVRYSEHFIEPGQTMLSHACRMGLEGVISKRADVTYRSGRGRDWVKSKCSQRQEFIIAGYMPSKGSTRSLGSIVTAYHEGDELKGAGKVGTGFTQKSAAALKKQLDALKVDRSPLSGAAGKERGIVWVKPELVAEVDFRAWTASKTLRHASFVGLREDKPAAEIVAERPKPASKDAKPAASKPASKAKPKPTSKVAKAETSVSLSNPDKPLWPDIGLTKQELLDYYATVWPLMQPFVVGRPLSLLRAPNGIDGSTFFQKHAGAGMNKAVSSHKDSDGEDLLFIEDFDGLAALVQLGVVEVHVWGAKVAEIETPDQMIFDLDPDPGVKVDAVREGALAVRDRLRDLGFDSLLRVSGGKGFHVVVPLKPKAGWDRVKGFARDFAKAMEQAEPKRYTATLSKAARKGRIFIDYLRNGRKATAIAPYSTRGRKGATVALPVRWEDIGTIEPNQFTARQIIKNGPPEALWDEFFSMGKVLKG